MSGGRFGTSKTVLTIPTVVFSSDGCKGAVVLMVFVHYGSYGCSIMKTYSYNFDPLKPHFYIVKLEFKGVYIIFLFLLKNIDC